MSNLRRIATIQTNYMKNYYEILGIEKSASKDEIKKAFHKLAHKHHPDKAGGDEKKFKEVNEAYSVLSDETKRKQYDMYGSTGGFNQGTGGFDGFNWGGFQGFEGFAQQGNNGEFEFDLGDILGQFFGGGRARAKKGKTIQVDVELSFKESIFGAKRKMNPIGKEIEIDIPPGIDNGTTLRVPGHGHPAPVDENNKNAQPGQPGDLHVRVWVVADPKYKKEGHHLVTDLHIKLTSALLGDAIQLETLDGSITLDIPQGIHHGELLRVRGKGVVIDASRRGDLYVRILVDIPKKLSKSTKNLIEELKKEGL